MLPEKLAGLGHHVMRSRLDDIRLHETTEFQPDKISDFVQESLRNLAEAAHFTKQGGHSVKETAVLWLT